MSLQFFRPADGTFVGDCMPFYHDGTFRLYYLRDESHHQALGGLGGHQWAQVSTRDLLHWEHHPLAIALSADWEGSICTGSLLYHQGTYYGFYATRARDRTQHLGLAVSQDAVHFCKTTPNPLLSPPPGYDPYDYRDPVVFRDDQTGLFHLLITARLAEHAVPDRGGCLAHWSSADLQDWEQQAPFLIPGLPGAPECPDWFRWGDWYYLLFSCQGVTHYRLSRRPLGPWQRPAVDTLDGPAARVLKTAAWADNRRIGVAWLGTREGDRDDGRLQFGGNAVFRELVQHVDGTLGLRFVPELLPDAPRAAEPPAWYALTPGVEVTAEGVRLAPAQGLAVAACRQPLRDGLLSARVCPTGGNGSFGLRLCAGEGLDSGYELSFWSNEGLVKLNDQVITGVRGLDQPFTLQVVLQGDIIDVCVAGQRTLVDRCPERKGERVHLFALDARVVFDELVWRGSGIVGREQCTTHPGGPPHDAGRMRRS